MHFIKYKEQDYSAVIDFAVIKTVCAKHSLSIIDFQAAGANPEYLATICLEALKRGAKLEGKELSLTEDDILQILTESLAEFAAIFNEYVEAIYANPSDKKK